MRKSFLTVLALLLVIILSVGLASCMMFSEFNVNFVVDGEIYSTVRTRGKEIIQMPENPTKEGAVFEGWYWDSGSWKNPFAANSLLNTTLSSDISVYAKWI